MNNATPSPILAPDLKLLRMGLTPPEVQALATDDPCGLLSSQTIRALLNVALKRGSTLDQFVERMGKWRDAMGVPGRTEWKE